MKEEEEKVQISDMIVDEKPQTPKGDAGKIEIVSTSGSSKIQIEGEEEKVEDEE